MPRPPKTDDRLYAPQITALQTILRLVKDDGRIGADDKLLIAIDVEQITSILSKAQAPKREKK